jgi:hypothetical protein
MTLEERINEELETNDSLNDKSNQFSDFIGAWRIHANDSIKLIKELQARIRQLEELKK